ncbi:MAG: 16S rRNA (adenine(1518)-N(6)/adenine(1519)-N(6))-dimethyltransferase RsmA [Clostridium sp.]|nr:16S rRNA (adenine(1518)-N(6)/adenine(1519)-N(6))-dimethyltransferase RsmA [Clostridium sp.]
MVKLSNPANVANLLAQQGIRLKKKWGQNFLVDENILQKIVSTANLEPTDFVLEIGPGIGSLTQKLAEKAKAVTAVEIDARLLSVLQVTLADYDNVYLIHQDAMDVDWRANCSRKPVKLVANLPYNVATPLFYRWLKEYRDCFSLFVCMVQKEVAQRIVAQPGGKEYGALSVLCQYAGRCEIAFYVPRTVFFPRPDVSSAVVKITPAVSPRYDAGDEPFFFRLVDAVFSQRRKTLLNTIHASLPFSKEELAEVGVATGIDMSRRAETLSVEEFAKISRLLYTISGGI